MKRLFGLTICLLVSGSARAAEDDAVAYRLFSEGRFAEAAELFTDPAWKGVALYRSDQFWRAAEAFVRAGDPRSAYNLGNAYARLGYLELALDSYLRALSLDPGMTDAAYNAELVRKTLAERDTSGQSGIRPQARVIDSVEAKPPEKGTGNEGEGERGAPEERAGSEAGGQTRAAEEADRASSEGTGAEGQGNRREEAGDAGKSEVSGTPGGDEPSGRASGGSQAASEADDEAKSAGLRTHLEGEQATEQWLNRIVDDPAAFLKVRIALEARRRAANGTAFQSDDDAW